MRACTTRWSTLLVLALVACSGDDGTEVAPSSDDHGTETAAHARPSGEQLGTVQFPISCSEAAVKHAARGLALLHHMTYEDAHDAFAAAVEADPECAMGYWGQAMTVIHPLWSDPPSEADFERARGLLEEAESRGEKADWEHAYIEAAQGYFAGGWDRDERRNLAAFAAGWERVHRDFPEDPEAASFHALTLLATPLALLTPVPLKIAVDSVIDAHPLPTLLDPDRPSLTHGSSRCPVLRGSIPTHRYVEEAILRDKIPGATMRRMVETARNGTGTDARASQLLRGVLDMCLLALISEIERRTAIERITGHNQYAARACPGFHVPTRLASARSS